jgi:hypothetical protein
MANSSMWPSSSSSMPAGSSMPVGNHELAIDRAKGCSSTPEQQQLAIDGATSSTLAGSSARRPGRELRTSRMPTCSARRPACELPAPPSLRAPRAGCVLRWPRAPHRRPLTRVLLLLGELPGRVLLLLLATAQVACCCCCCCCCSPPPRARAAAAAARHCPGREFPGRVLLLLLAIDGARCSSAMEDGERRKKMTNGARASVIGERGCNEVYVFVYACSWGQVVSIRILWHSCGKQRIVMVCFKIGE